MVGERGPFWRLWFTRRRIYWALLSPALSSLGGGEGEGAASCAGTSLIQRQWGRGEGHKRNGSRRRMLSGVTGSSPQPSPPKEEREGRRLVAVLRCAQTRVKPFCGIA